MKVFFGRILKRAGAVICTCVLLLLIASQLTAAPVEEYRMKVSFNGNIIGSNYVRIVHRPSGETDYMLRINAVMPILFLTFTLSRTSQFTLDKNGVLYTYSNVSRTSFPGYEYDVYATNFGTNVVIQTHRGRSVETRVIAREEYTYLTGSRYMDHVGPNRTNASLRFLDLDSLDLYPADFSFVTNYVRQVGNSRESIYEIAVRSGFVSQRVTFMTRNDIPLVLELYLPFIGWTRTELVDIPVREIPAAAAR